MGEQHIVLLGAVAANVAIALTKFVAAGVTGSSAMGSEGVHSLVDTGNGLLLLLGLRRSRRPPSAEHPFGHGKEMYFWGLMVAVLIFGLGGGISMYQGAAHLRHPVPLIHPAWSFLVLAAALLFEGASFALAWRRFQRQRGGRPLWQSLHVSKDPATYTVLAEDGAALSGLVVAAVGIGLGHLLGEPAFDAAASIVIGLLLACVAVLLVHESRGLLVGEGVSAQTAREIQRKAGEVPGVLGVGPVLSMYIGPDDILVTTEIAVDGGLAAAELAARIERIKAGVRERYPRVTRIYIEPRL